MTEVDALDFLAGWQELNKKQLNKKQLAIKV